MCRLCHSPIFVSDYFSQCLIWSLIISRYPKHIFFFPETISLTKLVPWDADRSWKGIDLIRSLSTEKTSKTCQNIGNFQIKKNAEFLAHFQSVKKNIHLKEISFHGILLNENDLMEICQNWFPGNISAKSYFWEILPRNDDCPPSTHPHIREAFEIKKSWETWEKFSSGDDHSP